MAPEREMVLDTHDVLLALVVVVTQGLQDAYFNAALLVQLLPVLEDLQGDELLVLVIIAADHDAEGSLTELLLHFISVVDVVLCLV